MDVDTTRPPQALFGSLSALAVSPAGSLHVADNSALQILTVEAARPSSDARGQTHIVQAGQGELYTFNKFGQHVRTRYKFM